MQGYQYETLTFILSILYRQVVTLHVLITIKIGSPIHVIYTTNAQCP